ncbi:acetoin reductase family protein [Whalleya microplaca]|nr:acetoin reductase family protein [Whalleya microplaca]
MEAVALVTGCAQGIGRAIALRLASDGFHVAINDLQNQSTQLSELQHEIELKGRRCVVVPGDVSIEDNVISMIENTAQTLGRLDVMIANAGTVMVKSLLELSVEEWDRVQAINVRGTFLCYKHAAKQMIKQGGRGKLIGACSISGYRPSTQTPAYSISKWAVRGLTQVAAMDLAQHGITVNSYCPGMVRTEMWDTIDSAVSSQLNMPKGAAFEAAVQARPALKRAQTSEDIAGLVSFLAGKDSNQITGQSIIVDGGIVFS